MKKLFTMALAVGMLCNAQAADLYKASRNVALRAPAVPLITSDPYLSIWSPRMLNFSYSPVSVFIM